MVAQAVAARIVFVASGGKLAKQLIRVVHSLIRLIGFRCVVWLFGSIGQHNVQSAWKPSLWTWSPAGSWQARKP